MLDVGKPCTHTSAGAPGVPQRRENTVTSRPLLAAVVDSQRSRVPPLRQSSKMSTRRAYVPVHFGGRFSANAIAPSLASLLLKTGIRIRVCCDHISSGLQP